MSARATSTPTIGKARAAKGPSTLCARRREHEGVIAEVSLGQKIGAHLRRSVDRADMRSTTAHRAFRRPFAASRPRRRSEVPSRRRVGDRVGADDPLHPFIRLHLADVVDTAPAEDEVVGVGQEVPRIVVAALVLEDPNATVDRASNPKACDQASREPRAGARRRASRGRTRRQAPSAGGRGV